MKKITISSLLLVVVLCAVFCKDKDANLSASDKNTDLSAQGDIVLVAPKKSGGKPIMTLLETRKTERVFSPKELPKQMLSDLMWAAAGRSRNNSEFRTIPTSRNQQEMDVYAFLSSGIYKYDHKNHTLVLFKSGDLRETATAARQEFAKTAPVNIVIVSNFDKIDGDAEYKAVTAGFHAGAISQNIYLYCTSVGLNTVVRKWLDYDLLSKTLELNPNQRVTAAQTVGFGN